MALPEYRSRAVRAMVILHTQYLQEFVEVWREANTRGIRMPPTDDQDYASMEALLRHLLRAARGYMTWMCEKLGLPDPEIRPVPEVDEIAAELDGYLEHLLDRWRTPLASVAEERLYDRTYTTRWGMKFYIESMLEHAVVHPLRHTFQLRELIAGAK